MNDKKLKIIIIGGPTGAGKTSMAINLARRFKGEIIGADSMQLYKHMDIGSAKPTVEEQLAVRHHLIDFLEPNTDFDAAAYAERAHEVIRELKQRSVVPFIVGGTGLYIKALLYGLSRARPANPDIIAKLKAEAMISGSHRLHKRLSLSDPEAAAKIHPNDTFRILRALEMWESTGMKISSIHASHGFKESRYDSLMFCLTLPREQLYMRIEQRVEQMMDEGFLNEVKKLRSLGYHAKIKSMQSIGYRHINDFIDGQMDLAETVSLIKRDTRRYAKRQLTWFKGDPEFIFVEPGQMKMIENRVAAFLR